MKKSQRSFAMCIGLLALPLLGHAADVQVRGPDGKPLPLVMVSRLPTQAAPIDTSDNGYAPNGKLQQGSFEFTGFTDF